MSESLDRLESALADRYAIERAIGAGGMATVYLARDLRHERQVAVKVLRPEVAATVRAERFLQEVRVTADLQHPHISPLFGSGEADGFLYFVMPSIKTESWKLMAIPWSGRSKGAALGLRIALDHRSRRPSQ